MTITLLKLGGSLITDKSKKSTPRLDVLAHIAQAVHEARAAQRVKSLIIGHGSGSFGHFEASTYQTLQGVYTDVQWHGFARVAHAANQLNLLVMQALLDAQIPAFRLQPSATLRAEDGQVVAFYSEHVLTALQAGLVPVVHGDVAFDSVRGGTIVSTEMLFTYLAHALNVTRIVLLGEVDGVLDEQRHVIPHISPHNIANYRAALGGSEGVDVTGGMLTKVSDMLALASVRPQLAIYIVNGLYPERIVSALLDEPTLATLISSDSASPLLKPD